MLNLSSLGNRWDQYDRYSSLTDISIATLMNYSTSRPTMSLREALARRDSSPRRHQVGSWLLGPILSRGAMSEVYSARPIGSTAQGPASYAVKILDTRWEDQPEAVELVRREGLVGSTVSHSHVVPILDWSTAESPYYTVMPCLEGTTLAAQLSPGFQAPLPVALGIVRQAAEGLQALFEAGWMHADVKPENIHLAPDGHAMLIDLGYARRESEAAALADRPIVGTLEYLAPEMLTSSLSGDIRSDLYSLGVVLYELLTGHLPFEGRNPAEIALMQRQGVPDRLRCLRPELPSTVVTLVRHLLAKEPLRRPQTPHELVNRLVPLEIATFTDRFVA